MYGGKYNAERILSVNVEKLYFLIGANLTLIINILQLKFYLNTKTLVNVRFPVRRFLGLRFLITAHANLFNS